MTVFKPTSLVSAYSIEISVSSIIHTSMESILESIQRNQPITGKPMGLFVYETGSEKVSRLFRWINRLMKFEKFEQKGSRVIAQYHLHPLFHGVRTLTLTPKQDGTTHFNLKEELKGWFVILVKSSIEMAKENMEHYAMKLKTETEHRSKELVSSEH